MRRSLLASVAASRLCTAPVQPGYETSMSGSPLFQPAGAALPRTVDPRISIIDTGDKDLAINAWRGIAALLVAYFHCRQVTWVGMHEFHRTASGFDLNVLFSYLTFPIAWGSAGVPIFFVISGY